MRAVAVAVLGASAGGVGRGGRQVTPRWRLPAPCLRARRGTSTRLCQSCHYSLSPTHVQFTNTGQNVAASAFGSVAAFSAGTTYSASGTSQSASYGNDMVTDPYLAALSNLPAEALAGCTGPGAWTVTFPVVNPLLYPLPQPFVIASVVMINRLDCPSCLVRMNGATVSLTAPNFTTVLSGTISLNAATQLTAATINFGNNAQAGPIFWNSSLAQPVVTALQASTLAQNTYVRYINVTSAHGKCLYFRELYVFDVTTTNVALYKPTRQIAGGAVIASYYDPVLGFTSFPSYGTDGIVDMDNPVRVRRRRRGVIVSVWETRGDAALYVLVCTSTVDHSPVAPAHSRRWATWSTVRAMAVVRGRWTLAACTT